MNKNLFFLLLIISASYIHGMKRLSSESADSDRPFKKQENMHNVFQVPQDLLRNIFSREAFKKSECELTGQNISWWIFHNSISEDNAISDVRVDSRSHFAAVASGDKISYINVESSDPYEGSYMLTNHEPVRAISMSGNDLAVAAGSYVEIFDTKTTKSKAVFHDAIAEKICLSPDGKLIAMTSGFKINIRDSKTKKLIGEHNIGMFCTTQVKPIVSFLIEKNNTAIQRYEGIHSLCLGNYGKPSVIFTHSGQVFLYEVTKKGIALTGIGDRQFTKYIYVNDNTHFAVGISHDKVCIIDIWHKVRTAEFNLKGITAACMNENANVLVTGSGDGTVRIFRKYTDYTREQLILKDALLNWFLIEKPNKEIVSLAALLDDVASKSGIFFAYIVYAWRSFPENMQRILESKMLYRIQKYGKYPVLL